MMRARFAHEDFKEEILTVLLAAGEDESPFPVKLRSINSRGSHADGHDAEHSPFPAVKLKSVARGGTLRDKAQEDKESPFGVVCALDCVSPAELLRMNL